MYFIVLAMLAIFVAMGLLFSINSPVGEAWFWAGVVTFLLGAPVVAVAYWLLARAGVVRPVRAKPVSDDERVNEAVEVYHKARGMRRWF